jgi:hypothetical protein
MRLRGALQIFESRIEATPLALCRMMVGAAALVRGLASYFLMLRVLGPGGVRAPWFDWSPAVSLAAVPWLIGIWLVAAFCFLVGFRTRLSGAVLTAVIGYYLLAGASLFGNHIYFLLLIVFLMTIADSGAVFSVDWYLRARPNTKIAYGPVLLLKIQVAIVYLFSAIAKLNPAFLSGDVLLEKLSSFPDAWMSPELAITVSWATMILEFYLVFALWIRRLRLSAIISGLIFHGLIVATMSFYAGLITYSTTIVATYWLYLSEEEMDSLRRWAGRLLRLDVAALSGR